MEMIWKPIKPDSLTRQLSLFHTHTHISLILEGVLAAVSPTVEMCSSLAKE